CVQESLLLVHDSAHWTRIGSDLRNVLEGTERCLAKHASELRHDPVALASWLTFAGDRCFPAGRFEDGRRYYRRAREVAPLGVRRLAHLILGACPPLYRAVFGSWRRVYWGLRVWRSR